MAKSQNNMFGSFGKAADDREREQQDIQAVVLGEEKMKKRGQGATTMTLAISAEDKQLVKAYAARNSTSVSDLLHRWIQENCTE